MGPHRPRHITARTGLGQMGFDAAWAAGKCLAWDKVINEVEAMADASTEALAEPPPSPDLATSHGMSRREQEVLYLLADGRSNRSIAVALSLSERTVENHVFHILTKLGLESRTAAATYAVRHGLV